MTGFTGFPTGKNPFVPVPEVFFTGLLPEIEDMAELKVTLHLFWRLAQKQGKPPCVSDRELLTDRELLRGLRRQGDVRPEEERVRQGLELAQARGTILCIHLKKLNELSGEEEVISLFFFNTARSRKMVRELERGELPADLLSGALPEPLAAELVPVTAGPLSQSVADSATGQVRPRLEIQRPNIFVLYEQNIGLLTPLLANQLEDAAEHYPQEWIEEAFSEAVQRNIRNWKYIQAILRRWETEGK